MQNYILVTGGAGYIGSHTCKALFKAGFIPVTLDNLSVGHRRFVKWGPLEVGDLDDVALLDQIFTHYAPIAILHFAASSTVAESTQDPLKYYRNNSASAMTLLEALCRHGLRPFIFSSTCAVYGQPQQIPITEDHPCLPINPYGRSKRLIEQMILDLSFAKSLPFVGLRYFNAAGADADVEIGEWHQPETHLIPIILEAAMGMRKSVPVYGTDYPTPDGSAIRDYIHVSDLASAHVKALIHLLRGGDSRFFNLGTGQGFSVLEVIHATSQITGKKINIEHMPRREGDPAVLIASSAESQKILNWNPEQSDLFSMIRTAWSWQQVASTLLAPSS